MIIFFQHKTFVHLFDSVRQDWFAVASVLENVLLEVRIMFPDIGKIFIRSDNAGAYHCGQLWQAIPDISERTGKWIDFQFVLVRFGLIALLCISSHMRQRNFPNHYDF